MLSMQHEVIRLWVEGNYQDAIEQSYILLKEGLENRDYKSILTAHITKAMSYYTTGDLEMSFKHLELFQSICKEHGDEFDYLYLYNALVILYEQSRNYDECKDALIKCIDLSIKLEKYNLASNAYSNYSNLLIKEGEYEEALSMGTKAMEMSHKCELDLDILEVHSLLNIAYALVCLKELDLARKVIDDISSIEISKSTLKEWTQLNILKSRFLEEEGKYDQALSILNETMEALGDSYDIYVVRDIEKKRVELCSILNNVSLGYKVQASYIDILEKIREREIDKMALTINMKYNIYDIEKRANIDYLTGVYSRVYLEVTLDQWLFEANRSHENIVLVAIDMNGLKDINDIHGHLMGDEAIKIIGDVGLSLVKEGDLIGRYGGDEFIIAMRDSSIESGLEITSKFKNELSKKKLHIEESEIPIGISVGISENKNGLIMTFKDLFKLADEKLYLSKKDGGRHAYY